MSKEQLIVNIGRIERALSRIEQYNPEQSAPIDNSNLSARHEKLKIELREAIVAIDSMLAQQER